MGQSPLFSLSCTLDGKKETPEERNTPEGEAGTKNDTDSEIFDEPKVRRDESVPRIDPTLPKEEGGEEDETDEQRRQSLCLAPYEGKGLD